MTDQPRIYVTGAACAGVSTLGAVLAERLGIPQLDVDDFYWLPTDPPYSAKRAPEERVRLIRADQDRFQGWVMTGSFLGWGDALIRDAGLIVFVDTPTPVRLHRLDQREARRFGARIRPGGDMHAIHLSFRDWASRYDDPGFSGRSRAQHEGWLARQSIPVLRVDGQLSAQDLADQVLARITAVAVQAT